MSDNVTSAGSGQAVAPIVGLILTGGDARAAYQVGVLRAMARILPREIENPFRIICGTSAGAINATALAIDAGNFHHAVNRLLLVWKNFSSHQVYRTDAFGALRTGLRWLLALAVGGLGKHNPVSLLDNSPLRKLLTEYFDFTAIQARVDAGELHALSVTASGYASGQSVSFFQGVDSVEHWQLARRAGSRTSISLDHLMASTAIPLLFPPVLVQREYFGDGSMRQIAPISTALHLGAEKILVIAGGRIAERAPDREKSEAQPPSLAQIAGYVLNGLFLDSLEVDIERLQRINSAIAVANRSGASANGLPLRHIDYMVFSPSVELDKIAARYAHHLPWSVHFLLRGLGAKKRSGSNLVSYLLFERPYCRALIALGYRDAMLRRSQILEFLTGKENDAITRVDRNEAAAG